MGGGKKGGAKVEVTLYYMSQHIGVCVAADALRRIVIKEKDAWTGYVTTEQDILIDEEDLFGGKKKEGGVSGIVRYLPGAEDQLMPNGLAQKLGRANGADCPGFRGLTTLFFHGGGGGATFSSGSAEEFWTALLGLSGGGGVGFYWSANVPYLPSIWVTVERAPRGLTQTYVRILRLGVNEFPVILPAEGVFNGSFQFGPTRNVMAYFRSNGSIIWFDLNTYEVGNTAGFMFVGSVSSLALDSAGNAYFMGTSSGDDYYNVTSPGGTTVSTIVDSPTFLFDKTRVFEVSGSVDVYTSFDAITGYMHGQVYVPMAVSPRDFCADAGGNIIAVCQPDGSSSDFSLYDLGTGLEIGGPYTATARSDVSSARIFWSSTYHHFLVWMDDNWYTIDDTTFALKDSGAFSISGGGVPLFPLEPTAPTFWHEWTEYSVEDFSAIRTIDPENWLDIVSEDQITFNPWNNEFWSVRSSDSDVIVRQNDRGFYDANPAHIIYECLTDSSWGMGSPTTLIDTDSFEAAGVTLYNESLGLSMIWTRQAAIQDFVQEVLDHIQAVLYVDPATGLLTLKLIRGDYDAETLPELTPSNADLSNFGRKLWGEIINEINVTWTNPENEQDETVTVHDLASIATQGGVVSDGRNYYGVRTAALAQRLAQRDLRASGSPLASCEAVVDRTQWQLRPASCVKLVWPEYGLDGTIMRVTEVDYGKPGDPAIRLTLVEDVFGLDVGTYVVPPSSIWEDTSADPDALDEAQILTLPYYAAAQGGFTADAEYPDVAAGILGTTDNADVWNFEVWGEVTLSDGTTELDSLSTNTVAGYGLLAADLPAEAESVGVTVTDVMGLDFPVQGGFALLGAGDDDDMELALLTAVLSSGYTLNRGVLDTVPRAWPTGTPVWFISPDASIAEATVHAAGELVEYRLRPRTSQGLLSLAAASSESFTLSDRPWLPLRPAAIEIGGVQFNDITTPVDMIDEPVVPVTWANRNRLTEDGQVLAWTDSTVTPETDQTTTIEVLTNDLATVLATHSGLSGTTFDVPDTSLTGGGTVVFIRVKSERTDDDGTFESLQAHGLYVEVLDTTDGVLSASGVGSFSGVGSGIAASSALSASGVGSASFTGSTGPTDPSFSSTVLLVGFDSVDGSGNYTDESAAAHGANDVAGLTEPTLDTSVKKYGAGSASFNGTTNAMGWSFDSDWQFGSGEFTIETWAYFDAAGLEATQALATLWLGGTNNRGWMFRYDGGAATNVLAFHYSTTGANTVSVLSSAWTPTANTWYHLVVDCDATGKIRLYRDGVMVGSATRSAALFNSGTSLRIGQEQASGGSSFLRGHMDEFRITKGVARYASDSGYTVPTAAFPRS